MRILRCGCEYMVLCGCATGRALLGSGHFAVCSLDKLNHRPSNRFLSSVSFFFDRSKATCSRFLKRFLSRTAAI